MATVHIDTLTTLEMVEDEGAYIALTRSVLVSELSDGTFDVLKAALTACDSAGLTTSSTPTGTDYDNLVLLRRTPRLQPNNNTMVNVTLTYGPKSDDTIDPIVQGGTNLTQQSVAYDFFGNQIILQHTFPSSDLTYPNQTLVLGATVSAQFPQTVIGISKIIGHDFPWFLSHQWTGRLNSQRWGGASAGAWLCNRVDFDPHDMNASPKKWTFNFEFTAQLSGWQPRAWLTVNGEPPANLIENVGTKIVRVYPSRDFNDEFVL